MAKQQNKVRVIKINKEAVFELVYETFLNNVKEYFDIKNEKKHIGALLHQLQNR